MYKNQRIKDLPVNERPYERCVAFGAECLSDAELLGIIIRTGIKGKQSVDLANEILKASGDEGLLGVCKMQREELMDIAGIGVVKSVQLKCIFELSRRISKANATKRISFNNPRTIAEYYREDLRHKDYENLMMLALNTKSALLGEFNISKGTVNSSIASPREIFVQALRVKAVNIILIHNHPSGDPTPSREDEIVTRRIKDAGDIVGISLIDHIIIGDNSYISFREKELL
ncbi:MAG: DNA repair protein RadC [Clostridiales bacterium]|nr:DNA repair protein RadC [Clostridiales bacterium]